MQNLTITQRRSIRTSAGVGQLNIPIQVVHGSAAPHETGESWHYVTRGGSRIWHPSAYSKRGWGNMVYIHSTRRVVVGAEWIAAPVSVFTLAVAA
jgi:hypothetical protein